MTESLSPIRGIEAVMFDMDGTLIDSEALTDRAIVALLDELGETGQGLDCRRFHGVTWKRIDAELKELFPRLATRDLASAIEERFYHLFTTEPPRLIPGASAAFAESSRHYPTAIATGSTSQAVEHLLDPEVIGLADLTIEDYTQLPIGFFRQVGAGC